MEQLTPNYAVSRCYMLETPTQRAGFGIVANHVQPSSISTYLYNYIVLKTHSQNRTTLPLCHLRCFWIKRKFKEPAF